MIAKGILFDDIHSYDDFNLILSVEEIKPAKPKETYVDIPGGDGSIDLTEAHGDVKYNDRDCKFTFTMLPTDTMTWEEKKTQVSNYLNGKVRKITLDKDSDYYYRGRCTVDSYLSDKKIRQIVVTAKVHPYKYKQDVTTASFEITSTERTVYITNSRKPVCPTITCTNDNTVVIFDGNTHNLSAGTHKVLEIQFVEGNNMVKLSGTGTVTFRFQEADL